MFLQIHGKNDIGSILSKLHARLLGTAKSTGKTGQTICQLFKSHIGDHLINAGWLDTSLNIKAAFISNNLHLIIPVNLRKCDHIGQTILDKSRLAGIKGCILDFFKKFFQVIGISEKKVHGNGICRGRS